MFFNIDNFPGSFNNDDSFKSHIDVDNFANIQKYANISAFGNFLRKLKNHNFDAKKKPLIFRQDQILYS